MTKKTATEPSVEWIVKNARGFDKNNPGKPKNCELHFPQRPAQPSTSTAGYAATLGSQATAGVPIDANLAIHLISNFQQYYQSFQAKPDTGGQDLTGEYDKAVSVAKQALNITYGVSFDKDIIMKILSQTGCEGIRLYFCARETEAGKTPHVSLVAVGVDKDNYDLNYAGEEDKASEEADSDDTPTYSLMSEYGYPPDGDGGDGGGGGQLERPTAAADPSVQIDPHYFLLKKAVAGSDMTTQRLIVPYKALL